MGLRDHSHLLRTIINNAVGVTHVKGRAPISSASEDMSLEGVQPRVFAAFPAIPINDPIPDRSFRAPSLPPPLSKSSLQRAHTNGRYPGLLFQACGPHTRR